MRLIPDSNVLLRILTDDDPDQRALAEAALAQAEVVVLPMVVMCEVAWTLLRLYRYPREDVAADLRRLINAANVAVDRGDAEVGLAIMDAGGDFADGVIAYDCRSFGGEWLVTFDRWAALLLPARGETVRLPGAA